MPSADVPLKPGLPPNLETVLDGEIVTLDHGGRPSVQRLQQGLSLHHPSAVAHAVKDLPVQLMIYDILHLGEPTVHLPYTARRDLLDGLTPTRPAHRSARRMARHGRLGPWNRPTCWTTLWVST
ncbi:ATP-dependent DNA ligase [Streptomyces sp. NBC_00151]|uniref:ATP-dependent DNA ligase n=1 Tax=Streptomyces sp. NBC_00151 TaxID=2975669 RepID=UPI002DD8BFB1|nr:hypothetical protein [Streptomyces sp. NBC_00151]WRZ36647.1 hypothetical protein OG915_00100 [Streptomyces sp. NBC_00151]WRZ44926.1 hypothetical protein OG915_47435 [Streptomyces sp. NBC_00151]